MIRDNPLQPTNDIVVRVQAIVVLKISSNYLTKVYLLIGTLLLFEAKK